MSVAPWVETVSGTAVDLLAPTRDQIKLGDIAHSLARIARFNGHTEPPGIWSVADHSVLVMMIVHNNIPCAPPLLRLAALLHDAQEAFIGDIISPMKSAIRDSLRAELENQNVQEYRQDAIIGAAFSAIAANVQAQIHMQFGLPRALPNEWAQAVKIADLMALSIERRDLLPEGEREWGPLPEPPEALKTWAWFSFSESEARFLHEMNKLYREIHNLPDISSNA